MSSLTVLPIVIPAIAGALLILLHRRPLRLARAVSAAAATATLAAAAALFAHVHAGATPVYALGGWPAPFGIVLVADRLSAWMVLVACALAAAVLLYAAQGWDARGRHFHALFQFQIMGLNGAFLTGDLFNLFVFFEVMLIASYCLMLQGLGAARVRATLHYVAMNLTASGVFLIAVSLLYGICGTLNMAHLAERIPQLAPEDTGLLRTAALLLIGVFSVKAALFPLYVWLPAAYSRAAAPVAALFAIMTKVGVYSIIRVTMTVFGGDGSPLAGALGPWFLALALVTLAVGAVGALGAERLAALVAYLTVASVGTLLTAVAAGGAAGLAAAVYYLAHSTFVIAALFLAADLIGRERGALADALHHGVHVRHRGALGLAFLVGGATVAGLPPSSGFIGKLLVLQSVAGNPYAGGTWFVVLAASLLTVVGCVRAGSLVLWGPGASGAEAPERGTPRPGEWAALALLLAATGVLVVCAGPIKRYADAAAHDLLSPGRYVQNVLGSERAALLRKIGD